MSTAHNLAIVVNKVVGKGKKDGRVTLFIDLEKAYDSLVRGKLWAILKKRCKTAEDERICYLIQKIHDKQTLIIGEERIESKIGVAQGSTLSPTLFNVYLEEALLSQEVLAQLIRRGDILAYADDLVAMCQQKGEAGQVIRQLK